MITDDSEPGSEHARPHAHTSESPQHSKNSPKQSDPRGGLLPSTNVSDDPTTQQRPLDMAWGKEYKKNEKPFLASIYPALPLQDLAPTGRFTCTAVGACFC